MFYLAARGYRCIAHDRRGHGRSSQPWNGNDMDTYADDLAELVQALDLKNAIHVGHSTGGGCVFRLMKDKVSTTTWTWFPVDRGQHSGAIVDKWGVAAE
jgi:alpha-beta hydrolase superfamily lysophospholipase